MKRLALLLPLLLATPAQALAECERGTIIDQIDCTSAALARADAQLNAIWPDVLRDHPTGGVREEHTKDIRAAQRAWIAFRDADCEARSKTGIPKYWELNRLQCLVQMTRARTALLEETYLF